MGQRNGEQETIEVTIPTAFQGNQTDKRSARSSSGVRYEYTLQEAEKYANSMHQMSAAPKITVNTSMTSTIPAPPMSHFSSSPDGNEQKSTSSKSKSRQQKQSQAEIHRMWETEYVTDHLMKGTVFEYSLAYVISFLIVINCT